MSILNTSPCAIRRGSTVSPLNVNDEPGAAPARIVGKPLNTGSPFLLMRKTKLIEGSEVLTTTTHLLTAPAAGEMSIGPTFVPAPPAPALMMKPTTQSCPAPLAPPIGQ